MSKQFGEFDGADGVDHRREVMRLFTEVDRQCPEPWQADCWRSAFLRSLVHCHSTTCFARMPCHIADECSAVEAFVLFVQVTGVLGVPIKVAAAQLEDRVRRLKDFVLQNKVTA